MKRINKNFLVYQGDYFEIEFYYDDEGEILIWEDFKSLTDEEQADFLLRAKKLADSKPGVIHPKTMFNLEDDKEKIWAIKFGSNRFCSFFYKGGKIIVTNAYKKQSQKNRKKETTQIKKAAKCKADYVSRVEEDQYYPEKE